VSVLNKFFLANWTNVMGALFFLMVLICGEQIGERKVQKAWDEEKIRAATVQAKQVQRVADVVQSQQSINQGISNDFQEKKKLLLGFRSVVRPDDDGLRFEPNHGLDSVPSIPEVANRAAASSSDAVPDSGSVAPARGCEQLVADAAQTTLMVLAFQQWYRQQSQAIP
jgi:hypothetical protein